MYYHNRIILKVRKKWILQAILSTPRTRCGESIFEYEYLQEFEAKIGSLKGSVRDLCQKDLCKNIKKTGSLPCPFKDIDQ
jgi:hypothetical protein